MSINLKFRATKTQVTKSLTALLVFGFFCISPLYGMTKTTVVESNDDQTEIYEEDVWFGPGFYYGVWFDNEDNYWRWRGNHRGYPSNRGYYHHDHPVHYNHNHNNPNHQHHEGGHGHSGGSHGGGGHGGGGHR